MWMQKTLADSPVLWEPKQGAGMLLKKFQKAIEEKYNLQFSDYWELHQWSVDNLAEFWSEVYDFFGIICSKKYEKVIDLNIPMSEFPKWFEGARVNYAENLLRYRDEQIALILTGEDRDVEKVTYSKMYEEVELYVAAFKKLQLKKNDVVVCFMSNRKEAVFAMLAVISIGAIWTGELPLMGPEPVLRKFEVVEPKALITVDSFVHSGEEIDMLSKAQIIAKGLPSLKKVIIVPSKENSKSIDSGIPNSCFLDEFLELGRGEDGSVPPLEFEQVSFSHPILISYTSGTTGKPKAIVHGTGILLTICQHFGLHEEISRETVFFSVSPVGWASWTIFSTLLSLGFTLCLYEGFPYYLTPNYFWDLVDKLKVTFLFLPSSVLDELQKRGYVPQTCNNLSSLQCILASGSIVKPHNFDYVKEKIGSNIALKVDYGGTECMGAYLITSSTLPIHRGEIPCPDLGYLTECLDDSDKPVMGQIGELFLGKPVPSLPLCLWGDPDGSLYREKFFSKLPGKFSLGDYGIVNPITKGFVICGRSDETMKQRHHRFGSSQIYAIVEEFAEVRDSICVSQFNQHMDERAVLFLKMMDGYKLNTQLVNRIQEAIARTLTIEHVPEVILETKDIPYNMNGKKMESVVKGIINKMPHQIESVVNKESLEFYHNVPELQAPF